jgi:hypothetical protein
MAPADHLDEILNIEQSQQEFRLLMAKHDRWRRVLILAGIHRTEVNEIIAGLRRAPLEAAA